MSTCNLVCSSKTRRAEEVRPCHTLVSYMVGSACLRRRHVSGLQAGGWTVAVTASEQPYQTPVSSPASTRRLMRRSGVCELSCNRCSRRLHVVIALLVTHRKLHLTSLWVLVMRSVPSVPPSWSNVSQLQNLAPQSSCSQAQVLVRSQFVTS